MTLRRSTVQLVKYLFGVIILVHWLTCVWHMTAMLWGADDSWIAAAGMTNASNGDKYLFCFYWARLCGSPVWRACRRFCPWPLNSF